VDAIAILQQIRPPRLVRKGFANLLSRPGSHRMGGHNRMNDAATVVRQDEEDEQDAEARRWVIGTVSRADCAMIGSSRRGVGLMRVPRVVGGPNVMRRGRGGGQAARRWHLWWKPPTSGKYHVSVALRVIESIRGTTLTSINVGCESHSARLCAG
jgi:hypothetical protein